MLREETRRKWITIIQGYDHKETINQYCQALGISSKSYFRNRKLLEEENEQNSFLPVVVTNINKEQTTIQVNHIQLSYISEEVNDKELSRILRLCRDL